MKLQHILNTKQFSDIKTLQNLFRLAEEIEKNGKEYASSLHGKILTSVFYEPSTRTRLSFEAAMYQLGGNVLSIENALTNSSAKKGETLQDTIRTLALYADVIVLRHEQEGGAELAASVSSVPIINAGDGSGEHPTQALLDLYTIQKELGRIDGLSIAIVGDIEKARQVHSLTQLLSIFPGVHVYLISSQNKEEKSFKDIAPNMDVIYMVRTRKEYGGSSTKKEYILDKKVLDTMKENSIVMSALPRNQEIHPEVDEDQRAAYFRQVKNGLFIRMALLYGIFYKI